MIGEAVNNISNTFVKLDETIDDLQFKVEEGHAIDVKFILGQVSGLAEKIKAYCAQGVIDLENGVE